MKQHVVTRFAPSPTGFLHIGGARTALFNWLYAQHHNGKMLLRLEDTDQKRSTENAVDTIIEGLKWLGLNWDGSVISQSSRSQRHRTIAEELVKKDKAYYCYTTPEQLESMRQQATSEGHTPHYDRYWRTPHCIQIPHGIIPAIRIKAPLKGHTIVHDRVQGQISFPNKDLDDFIILRADGTPTYMLSVVVDDHDMGITHIIRGDDHLTNAARQKIIYQAMDWDVPLMAHIPLIHGTDGKKLSKRHGALAIDAYRKMGYLPNALLNYLVRLGWSHGNDEIISQSNMIKWFDIGDINKSAARFDFMKLQAINSHYIRTSNHGALEDDILAILYENMKDTLIQKYQKQLHDIIPYMKERAKTLVELIDGASFIFSQRPLSLDEKAYSILNEDGINTLTHLFPHLEKSIWSTEKLSETIRTHAKRNGLKLGSVAQPLRAAITGHAISPSVFQVLTILGREESLGRIRDAMTSRAKRKLKN
ncbi:MAG: glutamyl-tRNA synthetase [Candidatus Tokpelaia sp. JSC161]|jgi:glutamyl-tRNA synthetase|nr:MAG: glutamyl-tRNA synthetase [Candidatus Tokpelaia sp. JSC161]